MGILGGVLILGGMIIQGLGIILQVKSTTENALEGDIKQLEQTIEDLKTKV